jgi:cytochrome bd ubiquinol oxidase subunit I
VTVAQRSMAGKFGTNWSHYSAFAGSITGPLLSYEVLTAFFLEAGFLGVALFGWNRAVKPLMPAPSALVLSGRRFVRYFLCQ